MKFIIAFSCFCALANAGMKQEDIWKCLSSTSCWGVTTGFVFVDAAQCVSVKVTCTEKEMCSLTLGEKNYKCRDLPSDCKTKLTACPGYVAPVITVAPTTATVKPVAPTNVAATTAAPVVNTPCPPGTVVAATFAPAIRTVAPPIIQPVVPVVTAAPVVQTVAPVVQTVAPVVQTVAPVVTAAPVVQTVAPVVTAAPMVYTAAPVVTTAPVAKTVAPSVILSKVVTVVKTATKIDVTPQTVVQPGVPAPTATGCSDSSTECCYWATIGECDKNPFWMKPKCQKACGTCGATLENAMIMITHLDASCKTKATMAPSVTVKPTATTMATKAACANKHSLCNFWAFVKECTKNPVWMVPNCTLACKKC